jgi:hypothetical protein
LPGHADHLRLGHIEFLFLAPGFSMNGSEIHVGMLNKKKQISSSRIMAQSRGAEE